MDTQGRIALAGRILRACRGETASATRNAILEVAAAVGLGDDVKAHEKPILSALSLVRAAEVKGLLDALHLVLSALERGE